MEQWIAAHGALVTSRGDIPWPARSSEVSVCDYFPWGYLKSKVYLTKPSDIDEFKYAIKGENCSHTRRIYWTVLLSDVRHVSAYQPSCQWLKCVRKSIRRPTTHSFNSNI